MPCMRGLAAARRTRARSMAAMALVMSGCAHGSAGVVPVPLTAVARPATSEMPHTYYLVIRNLLTDHLRFTLTPAKGVILSGGTSFDLAPHGVFKDSFALDAIVPGRLLEVEATDAASHRTLHQELSIVGRGLVCKLRLQRDSGIAVYAAISLIGKTSAKLVIEDRPATAATHQPRRLSHSPAMSDYRVTLDNGLPTEALHVSVNPGKDATLHGPSSFVIDPTASKTVRLSEPASETGSVASFEYDGISDFPQYPINVIADQNAILGLIFLHSYEPNAPSYEAISLQAAAFHETFVATATVSAVSH
jgi:hypothetical protein